MIKNSLATTKKTLARKPARAAATALRVKQKGPREYGVFLKNYLLKKFATRVGAEAYVKKIHKMRKNPPVKRNSMHPLMLLSLGTSGMLSALQIHRMLKEQAGEKSERRSKAPKRPNPAAGSKSKKPARKKRISQAAGRYKASAELLKEIKREAALSRNNSKRAAANPRKSNGAAVKTAIPRRQTFEMFQGRRATTARQMAVSNLAPARLDQLGDLIEIRLTSGQTIKPNPGRFKLCASRGRLWVAGGRFATPNPRSESKALDTLGVIDHVVYGTKKPHHGDHSYTHYIHKLGEESGGKPTLAVDRDGFPVIRGGNYKIEARGIVD